MSETRTSLVAWWERKCQMDRQKSVKPYPLPWDGASHAVMANFFAVVGFGTERHGTKEQLGTMIYMARPWIVARFIELWPVIKPEWMPEDAVTEKPETPVE